MVPIAHLTAATAPEQLRLRARLAWRAALPQGEGFWKRFQARGHGLGLDVVGAEDAAALAAAAAPGVTVLFLPPQAAGELWPDGAAVVWCSAARGLIRRNG